MRDRMVRNHEAEPRVLFDTRSRHFHQNPYISDLVASVPCAQIDGFTWRRAFLKKYDVIHIHWPEWLVKHERPLIGCAMRVLTTLALLRWKMAGTPILRTVHNREPHTGTRGAARSIVARIEKQADRRIWLSVLSDQRANVGEHDAVIPHPDYGPLLRRLGIKFGTPSTGKRAFCFGSMVSYRRFEEVVSAAAHSRYSLTVAGAASDDSYAKLLERASAPSDGRVVISRGRLSDRDLIFRILDSNVVFVPYDDLYNSGVIFLSLSVGRPVAIRAGEMADQLIREYGSTWIRTWTGVLSAASFEQIMDAPAPVELPHSAARDWSEVGQSHLKVYRAMMA